jgi:methylphosphotriester-DNA--protein-cysteine methyltransferase
VSALRYQAFAPSAALAPYVACYWTLTGRVPRGTPPERVVPDGHPELVWDLADPVACRTLTGVPRVQGQAVLVGQITRPILLQPTGRIDLLAIRFRPEALGAFLNGLPADRLTDLDFRVSDVVGARLRDFGEHAAEAPTAEARIALLEARLLADLRHAAPVDRRIAAAVALIAAHRGTARVDEVAAAVEVGPRQLERLFLAQVGLGPKRLARITRFHAAIAQLSAAPPASWSRVALRCGYYDQAHLIRDFRELGGASPGSFLSGGEPSLTEAFLGAG